MLPFKKPNLFTECNFLQVFAVLHLANIDENGKNRHTRHFPSNLLPQNRFFFVTYTLFFLRIWTTLEISYELKLPTYVCMVLMNKDKIHLQLFLFSPSYIFLT